MRSELRAVFTRQLIRRNFTVALVVGTILNLINQLDFLLAGDVNVTKLALTYCVPFFVASYGSYNIYRTMDATKIDRDAGSEVQD